jgi:hypothetical protein
MGIAKLMSDNNKTSISAKPIPDRRRTSEEFTRSIDWHRSFIYKKDNGALTRVFCDASASLNRFTPLDRIHLGASEAISSFLI